MRRGAFAIGGERTIRHVFRLIPLVPDPLEEQRPCEIRRIHFAATSPRASNLSTDDWGMRTERPTRIMSSLRSRMSLTIDAGLRRSCRETSLMVNSGWIVVSTGLDFIRSPH